jgi:hypothetical protein
VSAEVAVAQADGVQVAQRVRHSTAMPAENRPRARRRGEQVGEGQGRRRRDHQPGPSRLHDELGCAQHPAGLTARTAAAAAALTRGGCGDQARLDLQ